jgi:hypothetical protein
MGFNVGNMLGGIFNSEQIFFIDNPYLLTLTELNFVQYEIEAIYKKLLFDCLSRSEGLPKIKAKKVDKQSDDYDLSAYYDSVIFGEAGNLGLVSLVAKAMREQAKVYLVYDNDVIRIADEKEKGLIENGKLKNGAACNFEDYQKTHILKFYFVLLYTAISALNTQMNVSKSIQIKISKLRDLVGVKDSSGIEKQAKKISAALKKGNSVLMDELDKIESMKLDTKPATEAMDIIISRLAAVIGMPVSYLNGVVATGLAATGQGDEMVVERGLQNMFNEVFKRVSDKLLGTNLKFKTNVWGMITERLKLLPIVESSTLYSEKEKKEFAQKAINP